jgi:two-component system OmpR family sensor kinase
MQHYIVGIGALPDRQKSYKVANVVIETGLYIVDLLEEYHRIPDPDEVDLVWEDLYRSEQVKGAPGSGLDLPMVRAVIEKHGGEVALRSIYG